MSHRPAPPADLWGRADRLVLCVALGAGLALLAAGYWGVSGTRVFDDQVGAARLAAAGVLVAQAGCVVAVSRGRRALGRRLQHSLPATTGGATDSAPDPTLPAGAPVAASDMTRYHRNTCEFVAGKATFAALAADHEREGRRPCGMCRPVPL